MFSPFDLQLFNEAFGFDAFVDSEAAPWFARVRTDQPLIAQGAEVLRNIEEDVPSTITFLDREPLSEDRVDVLCDDQAFLFECDCELHPRSRNCCVFSDPSVEPFVRSGIYSREFILKLWKSLEVIRDSWHALSAMRAFSDAPEYVSNEIKMFHYRVKRNAAYRIMLRWIDDRSIIASFRRSGLLSQFQSLEFIDLVYCVRNLMGDVHDYGLRNRIYEIRSQGLTCSRIGLRLVEKMTSIREVGIKEYAKQCLDHYWEKFKSMFSFLPEYALSLLDKALSAFTNYVCESIFGKFGSVFADCLSREGKIVVSSIVLFTIWVIFKIMNLMTDSVSRGIYQFIVAGVGGVFTPPLKAQESPDYLTLLSTICMTVIGISSYDFKSVKGFATNLVTVMAGGTVLSNAFKTLLVLLPPTIKMAFTYRFGTTEQRFEMEVEQWRCMAQSLCSIARIQSVLGSKDYAARVSTLVTEGGELIRRCPPGARAQIKQAMMISYVKLNQIHTLLTTKKYQSVRRDLPFAFHVSGPPGIGKTTSIMHLLTHMGYTDEDIYCKDVADEFFSGLVDHKVIVMDEFLLGTPEDNFATATQYLTMVSSNQWRPAFASVDDPMVGIKGSVLKPEVVATINNTPHDNVDNKINVAFQRRRRFVIKMYPSDEFVGEKHNQQNVDFASYTNEQCRNRVWARFDILPPVHALREVPIASNLTYQQLLDFMLYQQREHKELCRKMRSTMNGDVVIEEKSSEEILHEVLRDTYNIPSRPIGLMEALAMTAKNAMTFSSFFAQGPWVDPVDENGRTISNEELVSPRGLQLELDGIFWDSIDCEALINEYKEHGEMFSCLSLDQMEDRLRNLEKKVDLQAQGPSDNGDFWKEFKFGFKWGATAAVVVLVTQGIYNFMTGKGEIVSTEETFCAQSRKTDKTTKNPKSRRTARRANRFHAQGPVVPVVELIHEGKILNAIAIADKWFLTYAHGMDLTKLDGTDITVKYKEQVYKHQVDPENVFVYGVENGCTHRDDDILMLYIDCPQMPKFKNIVKYFIKMDEIDQTLNTQIKIETENRTFMTNVHHQNNVRYVLGEEDKTVTLEKAAKYFVPTELGDCGLPVKITSGGLINKILGIHVAGSGSGSSVPMGIAAFVTQEMIYDVMTEASGQASAIAAQGPCETPNLIYEKTVNWNERVALPIKTKLRPSAIAADLPFVSKKEPAIMSSLDPRANGVCPVENSLKKLYAKENPEMDEKLLQRIEDELYDKFSEKLDWVAGKRQLTFDEACAGVPKFLNSITCQTSPGYPLCHQAEKRGKYDFVWFEGSVLKYTSYFRELVAMKLREMESYQGGSIEHRFLGYLKDELVKKSKIDEVRTRMTFANDMIAIVAFRMKFGALVAALMNSFETTGFAVGLNQYSSDMNLIHDYLSQTGTKFIAGDYGEFDQRYMKQAQDSAYRLFSRLASLIGVDKPSCDYLYEHETNCPFQILGKLVKVVCSNKSGCFLTTLINNLMNNYYVRYCFYRKYPELIFELYCKLVVQGDDHILALAKAVDMFPTELRDRMIEIGQRYTSAFKDRELRDEYDRFDEISFLGAIPRVSQTGQWTGALRKETLEGTVLWTRDNNASLDMTVQQMVDCASQWDREYFDSYVHSLKESYKAIGRNWVIFDQYTALHNSVIARTAASGADFTGFVAQGDVLKSQGGKLKPNYISGLTQVVTAEETEEAYESGNLVRKIATKAINAEVATLPGAARSFVKRYSYSWSSTSAANAVIAQIEMPFGLLGANNTSNVQDVGFYQYLYSQPEIELKFLVNGLPTQQGALVAYFQPLWTAAIGNSADYSDLTTFDHVFIIPNNNTAVSLKIPFRFWKTFLNNKKGFTNTYSQSMGQFVIRVFSPLTTQTLPTTAAVSVYSSIVSDFRVPRPRTANGQGPLVAQGATYSTTNVSNDYNVGSIVGNMPNQTQVKADSSQSTSLALDALPMDNPPISGCSLPVHNIFPSMSKAVGVEPTVSLQMHHGMLHRQPDTLRQSDATRVESLLGRRGYVNGFLIATTDTTGSELITFPLNSVLSDPTPANSNTVPLNMAVLNQFVRWRADIEIEVFVAKTIFHSARLLAVVGYGENGSLAAKDFDSYPSRILEFTGETQWASTVIPFNAPTEFLRTYDGANTQTLDDYSLGQFSIFVLNPLKASSSVVSSSCGCYIFVRYHNVKVYEPRSSVWVSLESGNQLYQLVGQGPMDADASIGSTVANPGSSSTTTTVIERTTGDDNKPEQVAVTAISGSDSKAVCQLEVGEKFEYCVRDITEIGRRHHMFNYQTIDGYSTVESKTVQGINNDYSTAGSWQFANFMSFYVYPLHPVSRIFAAWSGHLKYRFIYGYVPSNPTTGFLHNFRVMYLPSVVASTTQTVNSFAGTIPPGAGTVNSTVFDFLPLSSGQTVVGKTGLSTTATWNANTYIWKPDSAVSSAPIEVAITQGFGSVMIDVSVPFNTNNNILPTKPASWKTSYLDPYNGRLCIQLPRDFANEVTSIDMYQAWGDDFRLHCYSPITDHFADGYTLAGFGTGVITAPTAGQQIGQNVYGTHT